MSGHTNDTAESVLTEIVRRFTPEVLKKGDRVLGLFADLAPQLRREMHLLQVFMSLQGNTILLDAHSGPAEQKKARVRILVERMKSEYSLAEEAAMEICLAFWHALGNRNDPVSQMLTPAKAVSPEVSRIQPVKQPVPRPKPTVQPPKPATPPVLQPTRKKKKKSRTPRRLAWLALVLIAAAGLWFFRDALPFDIAGHDETSGSYQEAERIAGEMPPWQEPDSSYTMEVSRYNNGYRIERYYDQEDRERVRICYDSEGTVLFRFTADYLPNGYMYRQMSYDGEGNIQMRIEWGRPDYEQLTEIVYTRGDGTLCSHILYEYDRDGNITTVTAQSGTGELLWRQTYNYAEGLLREIVASYPDGRTIQGIYNEQGLLAQEILLDTRGNPERYWLYTYDYQGRMATTQEFDRYGVCQSYSQYGWNEDGTLYGVSHYSADGTMISTSRYTYDGRKERMDEYAFYQGEGSWYYAAMTDIRGQTVCVKGSDTEGNGWYRTYDALGNLLTETDISGSETVYHYDAGGNLTGSTCTERLEDGTIAVTVRDADRRILSKYYYDENEDFMYCEEYIYINGELDHIVRTEP